MADADLVEKFGALGVYQNIRSWDEMGWSLTRIVGFGTGKFTALTLDTDTGRQLAEPGRRLVVEFFRELKSAAEPYGDSSLQVAEQR